MRGNLSSSTTSDESSVPSRHEEGPSSSDGPKTARSSRIRLSQTSPVSPAQRNPLVAHSLFRSTHGEDGNQLPRLSDPSLPADAHRELLLSPKRKKTSSTGSSAANGSSSNSGVATDAAAFPLATDGNDHDGSRRGHSNMTSDEFATDPTQRKSGKTTLDSSKTDKLSNQCDPATGFLSDSNSQKQQAPPPPPRTSHVGIHLDAATEHVAPGTARGPDVSQAMSRTSHRTRSVGGEGSYTPFLISTSASYDMSHDADMVSRGDNGHSQDGGDASTEKLTATETSAYESANVKRMRAHNWLLTAFIIVFAIVIALAGGLSVGLANKRFSQETSRRTLVTKNRIVLNSSVASLHHAQDSLAQEGRNLFSFLEVELQDANYSTAREMRDALLNPFMRAWRVWLSTSSEVDTYSMLVPFCEEEAIGTASCSTMALIAACPQEYKRDYCYFGRNSNDGLKLELYDVPANDDFDNARLLGVTEMDFIFFANQTGNMSFFLPPSLGPVIRNSQHYALTLRLQKPLASGQLAICDTAAYMESWFNKFASTLQRAEDSYSMIFTSDGDVLVSQEGHEEQSHCFGPPSPATRSCRKSSVVTDMVETFLRQMPPSLLHEDVEVNGEYSLTKNVDNYLTAYQDFLRFRTEYTQPNIIYFVAYATPIDTSISTEGVVQIVVCVVVIVLCVLILGLVAVIAVNQMQKVIQLVSRLATHASTYDTENMEKALDQNAKNAGQRCWGVILSSSIIEEEFHRILDNLKAYRPFLPPSLLTPGHVPYDEDTLLSIIAEDDEEDGMEEQEERRRRLVCTDDDENGDTSRPASTARAGGDSPATSAQLSSASPYSRERRASASSRATASPGEVGVQRAPPDEDTALPLPVNSRRGRARRADGTTDDTESEGASSFHRELSLTVTGSTVRSRKLFPSSSGNGNVSFADVVTGVTSSARYTGSEYNEAAAMNDRLRKGGLRPVKGTILVVELVNLAIEAKDATEVINYYLATVLARAKAANGVVDVMDTYTVVVSFNCHFTVLRHQEKAVRCALNIRDDLVASHFGYDISIGIATGPLYVGTIGTETQRARVVSGDSVAVARQLTSLSVALDATILVTDAVAHACGGVAWVPVDVVNIYRRSTHTWIELGVCQVIGHSTSAMTHSYSMAKKLFKLIRGRHLDGAQLAVEAIKKAAEEKHEPIAWAVERLISLIQNSPKLIKEGYRRRAVLWETPEGEELIVRHVMYTREKASSSPGTTGAATNAIAATNGGVSSGVYSLVSANGPQSNPEGAATLANVPGAAASGTSHAVLLASPTGPIAISVSAGTFSAPTTSADRHFTPIAPPPVQMVDETARAKEMITAAQQTSVSRRQQACVLPQSFNEEDALFPVFLSPLQDDDEGDENYYYGNEAGSPVGPHAQASAVHATYTVEEHDDDEDEVIDTVAPPPLPAPAASPPGSEQVSGVGAPSPVGLTSPVTHLSSSPVVTINYAETANVIPAPPPPALTGFPRGDGGFFHAPTHSIGSSRRSNPGDSQIGVHAATLSGSGRGTAPPLVVTSVNGQCFYRTHKLLGRGAFGEVFLAISESGSFVAMKAFPVDGFNAPQLIREVETLSKLRDDHIVAYDCCAVQEGQFFIMTEYMSSGSVRDLIKQMGPLPLPAVRKYSRDILYGLAYLHRNNWLHCDIKPDNVLLTPDGSCKIADFGAAALERSVAAGGVRGTPRFMAPEAVIGEWSAAADIYSFGLTLATMLTGKQPWHSHPEPDHLFLVRLAGEVRYARESGGPCEMQPDLSLLADVEDPDLVWMVQRCCLFEPKERPTVEDLINLLL